MSDLDIRIARIRRQLDRERGEAFALATQGQALTEEIAGLGQLVDLHEKAAHVLTAIGEERQHAAQRSIEALVTQGLHTIFDDDISFALVPGVRAKSPVVDFVVRSRMDDGTVVETDVLSARGGGLSAVVGFLLRLVILLLSGRKDTLLLLDESFAHVSVEYVPRLIEFLKDLVAKTGVQVMLVTHDESFLVAADVVYRLDLINGVTKVRNL